MAKTGVMIPDVEPEPTRHRAKKRGASGELPKRRKTQPADLPRLCFVIARPRSGTTVFSKMLGTHPRVHCIGEIFNQSNEQSYFHFLKRRVTAEPDSLFPSNSTSNFLKYIEFCRRSAAAKKQNCKVVIIDVKYDQAHLLCEAWWKIGQLPKLFFLIREHKWKVMDIHRRDLVGLCISNQVAIKTKIYHSSALAEGEKQTAKIQINPKQILRDVQVTRTVYQSIEAHFANRREYKKINYEDMFDGDGVFSQHLLGGVSDFLGVHNLFDRTPKLQKLLSDDVLHHVENAAELRALIHSREFEYETGPGAILTPSD
jgi:hypothetical protein